MTKQKKATPRPKTFKRVDPAPTTAAAAREHWLNRATHELRPLFQTHGYTVPANVRLSCGWPSSGGLRSRKRAIGEAWSSTSSKDQHFEIFVSPTIAEPEKVLGVLIHELIHVTVGLDAGHKGPFAKCAREIGLEGKMTATTVSDPLAACLKVIQDTLGPYPHATLDGMTNGRKKQKARLIKAGCTWCGYTIRASLMWLSLAVPKCPNDQCQSHGETMQVDIPDFEEEPSEDKVTPLPPGSDDLSDMGAY